MTEPATGITLSLGALVALVTVVAMVATCGGMLIAGLCVIAGRADERMAEAYERERAERAASGLESSTARNATPVGTFARPGSTPGWP